MEPTTDRETERRFSWGYANVSNAPESSGEGSYKRLMTWFRELKVASRYHQELIDKMFENQPH